jgi:methylated-DNA-[protein]-cysteine S-methyltransferase
MRRNTCGRLTPEGPRMIAPPPERLTLTPIASPIGEALIVSDEFEALRAFQWREQEGALRRALSARYGDTPLESGRSLTLAEMFQAYFEGRLDALGGVRLAVGGTAFQHRVWAELIRIPPGETITYTTLAERAGRPGAWRAAGLANARNPVAVAVPCHRVIGVSGALTGYAGGLERKLWLLRHEAALA